MKVIAYARFSSSKQTEGTSVERQIEMAEDYAKKHGLTISERVIDRAKSAYHAAHKRGGMGQLLKRAVNGELGQGDIILVENLDRMSREKVMAAFDQLRMFTNAGLSIITVQDGQVLNEKTFDDQWSKIIEPLAKMASAHHESAGKSSRGFKTWDKRRKEGHILTTSLPAWLNQDRTPRHDRVDLVREIFDLCLSGKGSHVIAKTLTAAGKMAWGNGRSDTYPEWSSATVSRLLSNRAVMGEYQPKSEGEAVGPVIADYFPRIIEPDVFYRAQALIQSRKFGGEGSGRRAKEASNIFRGLALCGSCRKRMNIAHAGGVRYLRCYGTKSGSCSNTRGFNYDKLEEATLKVVSEIKLTDDTSATLRGIRSGISAAKHKIETLESNVDFLVSELVSRRSPALSKKLAEEEAALEDAREELISLEQRLANESSPLGHHQRELGNAWRLLETVENKAEVRERLNMNLASLVERMVLTANHNVMIHLKDHTTYILRYRLKPDLPKQKRVGARPLSDYEWYAGRVDMTAMFEGWKAAADEDERVSRGRTE